MKQTNEPTLEEALCELHMSLKRHTELKGRMARAVRSAEHENAMGLRRSKRDQAEKEARTEALLSDLSAELCELDEALEPFSQRVARSVLRMPPSPHRLVLRLRYVERLSVPEVARQAHYARGWVYELLRTGEALLRKREHEAD